MTEDHLKTLKKSMQRLNDISQRAMDTLERIDMPRKTAAEHVINAIIEDLSSRNGLGNEWDCLDVSIQKEIRKEWVRIFLDLYKR